ncbi:MAG TPA: hypothetical protein VHT52_05190 [Stellaceae bacterium]|nr:hypothetical protein [Stellaceae bacterium]
MPIQSANPYELHTLQDFAGLNQQNKRSVIDENEFWWDENLFVCGSGNLRSCWGHGPSIYDAPAGKKILRIFFGFIGNETGEFNVPPPGRLGWMFLDDGTVDQVDLDTREVTSVSKAGEAIWEPIGPQYWASAVVWRPQYYGNIAGQAGGVLFGSPQGLYGWDGTTLSAPGDPAPDWLTNAAEGPQPPPAYTMPVGLPGIYCMEVYQSRLFVAGKDVISYTAPANGADFSTTDGGGSFGYFGNKLTYTFNDLAASAGYLYVYGDSSIDLIGQITLSGSGTPESPYTTNMSYSNVDPQVGQRFPRPVGRIGRYMQMFNGAGIFECKGAEARPIGTKVTSIFNTLDTSNVLPTMAPATMFGFKVLLCNGVFTDPWGVKRNLLLMWHPTTGGSPTDFWSVASQNLDLTNISYYEQDSVITPYGTDGASLYQLFAQPDPALAKRLSTAYYRGSEQKQVTIKNWKRLFLEFDDEFGGGVAFTGKILCRGGGVPGGDQDIGFQLSEGQGYDFQPSTPSISGSGIMGGVDLLSYSPDFTIERLHVASEDRTLFGA